MTKLAVDDFPASEKIEIPPVLLTKVMGSLPFSAQHIQVQSSALLYYEVQCCVHVVYTVQFSAMLYYVVLMLRHGWLFPLLLVQCCASWVTNFTSPYLAWHSIYLSKWKLIYPFLFKLVVLSDFSFCFWPNFVFESNIAKETLNRLVISIFHIKQGA